MKRLLLYIASVFAGAALCAGEVTTGNGSLVYKSEACGDSIPIAFDYCMANKLFTFSRVDLNGHTVNATSSDNIGPFGLDGIGWSGGNHLNNNIRSARTDSVEVFSLPCFRPLNTDSTATYSCKGVLVKVHNTLFMPADTTAVFALENICYTVAGNSIEVDAHHTFLPETPVLVDRYYGMQSMFIGETEILTPGGLYSQFTPVAEVNRFTKASAPDFTVFIEHSPVAYQASLLDCAEGTLGDRSLVDDNDVVFIGNSYSKSYHKTIGRKKVHKGMSTRWHGIYSWFSAPQNDSETTFAYPACSGNEPTIISIDKKSGHYNLTPLKR